MKDIRDAILAGAETALYCFVAGTATVIVMHFVMKYW